MAVERCSHFSVDPHYQYQEQHQHLWRLRRRYVAVGVKYTCPVLVKASTALTVLSTITTSVSYSRTTRHIYVVEAASETRESAKSERKRKGEREMTHESNGGNKIARDGVEVVRGNPKKRARETKTKEKQRRRRAA